MYSKEELIKLVKEIDTYLDKANECFSMYEGRQVDTEYVNALTELFVNTMKLISAQYRLKKILLDEYGIKVTSKN